MPADATHPFGLACQRIGSKQNTSHSIKGDPLRPAELPREPCFPLNTVKSYSKNDGIQYCNNISQGNVRTSGAESWNQR